MTDAAAIFVRAVVAGALTLAITTLMAVTVSTAKAAGALAVGRCGAFGQAFDYVSIGQARAQALSQCRSSDCRVVVDLTKACAALAVDIIDPCKANGWGRSPQLANAQNGALRACYKGGGTDCVIRTFMCDAKG
jgi:hypothetical protein